MRSWLLLLVGLSSYFALSTSVNRAKNSGSDFDLESRASTTNVNSILSKRKLRAPGGDTNTLKDSGKARREKKVWKLFCRVFLQLDDEKKCMFETNQVSSHQPEPRPALSFMPGPKPAHSLVPESKPVRSLMTGNAPVRSIATKLKLVLPRITETVKNPSKSQVVMLWLHKVAEFSRSEHGVNTMSYRTLYEWLSPSFSDAKLAKFFVGLREDEALRETAEKMLAYMLIKSTSTEAVGRAWLKSGEHPSRLFESMNFKEADFKDTVFLGWLKYASLYEKHYFSQSELTDYRRQLFFYRMYDYIKPMYSYEKTQGFLEYKFEGLTSIPGMQDFGQNLADIARRERKISFYLDSEFTPEALFNYLKVSDENLLTNVFQWLRYCRRYTMAYKYVPFDELEFLEEKLGEIPLWIYQVYGKL